MSYNSFDANELYIHRTPENAKKISGIGENLFKKIEDQKNVFLSNATEKALIEMKQRYKQVTKIKVDEALKEIDDCMDIEELDKRLWQALTKSDDSLERTVENSDSNTLYLSMKSDVRFLFDQKQKLKETINDIIKNSKDLDPLFTVFEEILNRIYKLNDGSYITFIKEIYGGTNLKTCVKNSSTKESLVDRMERIKEDTKNTIKLTNIDRQGIDEVDRYLTRLIQLIGNLKSTDGKKNETIIEASLKNLFGKAFGEYTSIKQLELLLEADKQLEKVITGKESVGNSKEKTKNLNEISNSSGTFKVDQVFKGDGIQLKIKGDALSFKIEIGFSSKNYLQGFEENSKNVKNPSSINFKDDVLEFQLVKQFKITRSDELKSIYNYLTHLGKDKGVEKLKYFSKYTVFDNFIKSISGSGLMENGYTDFAQFLIINGEIISIYQLISFLKEGEKDNPISTNFSLGTAKMNNGSNRNPFQILKTRKQQLTRLKNQKKKREGTNNPVTLEEESRSSKIGRELSAKQIEAYRNSKVKGNLKLSKLKLTKYNLR